MKLCASALCASVILLLAAGEALASDAPNGGAVADSSAIDGHLVRAGQQSFAELDTLIGSFLGLRLKGIVYSGNTYNVALEGLYGDFLGTGLGSTAYGAGVRGEFYLSSNARHAWMISPAVDGYYVKANPCPSIDTKQTLIDTEAGVIALTMCSIFATPTRTALVAPKVDVDWLYQFAPNFGITTGLSAGAAIVVDGEEYYGFNDTPSGTLSLTGKSMAGKTFLDVGLTLGVRF